MQFVWRIVYLGLFWLVTAPYLTAAAQRHITLIVSAAANVTFAFQELGPLFEHATGTQVLFNFGSSGQLAQQIERGAPADVFIAANAAFVEMLERQGLIIPETRRQYARGRLTLWTRADSPLRLTRLENVAHADVRRMAIANPTHAPYGMAAREALQSAGIWEQIQPKLVLGENVRQTLQYAATGNVDVAIVALSLSVQHEGRWVLIPEALHQPIVQTLAVMNRTRHELQARQFVAFVIGPQGQAVLRKYGFVLPPRESRR
jgi:molybdate transport system substrate-binding protein